MRHRWGPHGLLLVAYAINLTLDASSHLIMVRAMRGRPVAGLEAPQLGSELGLLDVICVRVVDLC
eukprot:4579892-Pyramimonas_sp.AAC.1